MNFLNPKFQINPNDLNSKFQTCEVLVIEYLDLEFS